MQGLPHGSCFVGIIDQLHLDKEVQKTAHGRLKVNSEVGSEVADWD